MIFTAEVLRFGFTAVDEVRFPADKAGNTLRGAFGYGLRRVAAPDLFSKIFEPSTAEGPSGMRECPRPFVMRAMPLDGRTFLPGESFEFDFHFFLRDCGQFLGIVEKAFESIASEGVGSARARARLVGTTRRTVTIPLTDSHEAVDRVLVCFDSPTELKHDGEVSKVAEFGVLFNRARDRVSSISSLFTGEKLDIDFAGLGERARNVQLVRSDLRRIEIERRSSRTGQRHPIGGFVGTAEYEGAIGEFLPILQAAQWTGVGRKTVWGNGAIRVLVQ